VKVKNGDTIFFNMSTGEVPSFYIGKIICKTEDNRSYNILDCTSHGIYIYQTSNIYALDEKHIVFDIIDKYYSDKISEFKSQIQSINRKDYKNSLATKYVGLKTEILNTAKNMLVAEDKGELEINDFENAIKAISIKKKQLFEIECDEVVAARKTNGGIKFEIKKLETDWKNNFQRMDVALMQRFIK